MPGPSSSTVTVSQGWSQWPVIEIDGAWRAAFDTRLPRQRLNAAGRTVTIGWPWKFTLDLWPLRSVSVLSSSRKAPMSVGADCSPESPRAKAR